MCFKSGSHDKSESKKTESQDNSVSLPDYLPEDAAIPVSKTVSLGLVVPDDDMRDITRYFTVFPGVSEGEETAGQGKSRMVWFCRQFHQQNSLLVKPSPSENCTR